MSFYSLLSKHYNSLFPLTDTRKKFITRHLNHSRTVLDVGCATGALSFYLQRSGLSVTGIDSDTEMIKTASRETGPQFIQCKMENISTLFNPQSFDIILCLGNTIPHLTFRSTELFLSDCRNLVTEPYGQLFIQTVNFNKIIHSAKSFPVIETDHLIFRRFYEMTDENTVEFSYSIYSKNLKKEFSSQTRLSILTPEHLECLIKNAGFKRVQLLGSFSEKPYSIESDTCIAHCMI